MKKELLNPHKWVASSITRDVAEVELWDDEIEEREHLEKEHQEREKDEPMEDWDAPEAQTEPGNGLTWDEMIPKDHGVTPTWVEDQERELLERSLSWRCDPEGTWQRDPSPRWRIREEWARASSPERNHIMKNKLVMGPDSALHGHDVPLRYGDHGDGNAAAPKMATDIKP